MAKKKLIVPKFASENEDAGWQDRHRRELEQALERRIREGSTLTLQRARRPPGRFRHVDLKSRIAALE